MFRFIKYFVYEWRRYPQFMGYYKHLEKHHPGELENMNHSDLKRGIKPYNNRFDFAFRNAKARASFCDAYGRKCRKFGGNCDICDSKKKGW